MNEMKSINESYNPFSYLKNVNGKRVLQDNWGGHDHSPVVSVVIGTAEEVEFGIHPKHLLGNKI